MTRVVVNIDRIALRGLDPGQRQALLDGLRAALTDTLAAQGSFQAGAASRYVPALRLGRVPLEPGSAGGRRIGTQVAAAIGRTVRP